jgi:hypothetical protein
VLLRLQLFDSVNMWQPPTAQTIIAAYLVISNLPTCLTTVLFVSLPEIYTSGGSRAACSVVLFGMKGISQQLFSVNVGYLRACSLFCSLSGCALANGCPLGCICVILSCLYRLLFCVRFSLFVMLFYNVNIFSIKLLTWQIFSSVICHTDKACT